MKPLARRWYAATSMWVCLGGLTACAAPVEPVVPQAQLGARGSTQREAAGVVPGAPEMVPVQVSPSAWLVQGLSAQGTPQNQNFISNAGFIVTPAGVVVIDALGSPVLAGRMLAEIRKITPLPVTHVIVTHYHADHIYGLQVFKAAGARILAHAKGRDYVGSDGARTRLEASRHEIAPWIDAATQVVAADEWLDGPRELTLGGTRIQINPMGPAHTPEDLAVYLPGEGVLFAGDLVFRGRIPFVGQADSGRWVKALGDMLALRPKLVVPGHGPASMQAVADMELTRAYLVHLRTSMGKAAKNMDPFAEAYSATDWSRFESVPLFGVLNRMNAYNTYLLMEREGD
jgi:glyoxylase-like metal-dependent hydrolase (beta-lactamase superfamily II)